MKIVVETIKTATGRKKVTYCTFKTEEAAQAYVRACGAFPAVIVPMPGTGWIVAHPSIADLIDEALTDRWIARRKARRLAAAEAGR